MIGYANEQDGNQRLQLLGTQHCTVSHSHSRRLPALVRFYRETKFSLLKWTHSTQNLKSKYKNIPVGIQNRCITKELGNLKRRHWDLYLKPDASNGLNKNPQNVVFSEYSKRFQDFLSISLTKSCVFYVTCRLKCITLISLWINFILKQSAMFGLQFFGPFKASFFWNLGLTLPA